MPTFDGTSSSRSRISECLGTCVRYGKVVTYFTFKFVELIIAAVLLGLWFRVYTYFDGESSSQRTQLIFISSVLGAFMVISLGVFISLLSGHRHHAILDAFVSVISGVLYMSAGSVAIHHFHHTSWIEDGQIASGVNMGTLAIVQSFIYLADAVFVFFKAD